MADATNIAVIPARGGSKRVPKKNIRPFGGKPMIAYTIEAALRSGLFHRVIVSTDSAEIGEVARQSGAETPFIREAGLADDVTPVSAVTVDVLERLDSSGELYLNVCQLMPNCPLRTAQDVIDSYRQFEESRADSQLSVIRYGWQNPWWAMRRDAHFGLEPLFKEALAARSQDLPELFCPTGAIWWARASVLRRERTFHTSHRTGWEISWQHGVDIDTEEDWAFAEAVRNMLTAGLGTEP